MVMTRGILPLEAPLFERELQARAVRLRLVITDVDGVLTDGGVYYSDKGEAFKRFSVRDGMGVERLRNDGIETVFLTRESSAIVERRAQKLGVRCYLGVMSKLEALPQILADARVEPEQVGYIGDDVNDSDIMTALTKHGLVAAPMDAIPSVLRLAQYRCALPGGCGAFRDFAEWILDLRDKARWPTAIDSRNGKHGGR
jgi:3-deoxy-D-manno-octulosonate 8-phosphate phosphatase (KDO 8-P phosphatase)